MLDRQFLITNDLLEVVTLASHKSAAKRARQSIRKTAVNQRRASAVKTYEKHIEKALSEKNAKALPELLQNYSSEIMKAAQRGVMKRETASRKIGRISKQIHKMAGTAETAAAPATTKKATKATASART
jgi:small subunit ribosomal protein S20